MLYSAETLLASITAGHRSANRNILLLGATVRENQEIAGAVAQKLDANLVSVTNAGRDSQQHVVQVIEATCKTNSNVVYHLALETEEDANAVQALLEIRERLTPEQVVFIVSAMNLDLLSRAIVGRFPCHKAWTSSNQGSTVFVFGDIHAPPFDTRSSTKHQ